MFNADFDFQNIFEFFHFSCFLQNTEKQMFSMYTSKIESCDFFIINKYRQLYHEIRVSNDAHAKQKGTSFILAVFIYLSNLSVNK